MAAAAAGPPGPPPRPPSATGPPGDATPLAVGPLGMRLLGFHRLPEDAPPPGASLSYVLLVVRHRGLLLMVRERERGTWELPGGGIEPGETPRDAAVRELREETGLRLPAAALRFAGFTETELRDRGVRHGAVYAAEPAAVPTGFTPTTEISMIHWWNGTDPFADGVLQTTNSHLAGLVPPEQD